jgi:uncharacterized protein
MIITPLYAGILALLFFALCLRVSSLRGTKRASLGDGGDPELMRAIRGHANFAEFVPLILLMMALLELSKFSIYLLHAMGITLVLARLLHGYALSFTEKFKFGRFWGAALSYLLLVVGGVLCVYQGLRALPLS